MGAGDRDHRDRKAGSDRQSRKEGPEWKARGKMAATKRKRRGGLAVQAKVEKRRERWQAAGYFNEVSSEEAAEEEKDRIPGPVCMNRLAAAAPRAFVVVPT